MSNLIQNKRHILWPVVILFALSFVSVFVLFNPTTSFAQGESLFEPLVICFGPTGEEGGPNRECDYGALIGSFQRILNSLVLAAGFIAIILIIWAGILMVTSAENPELRKKGRSVLKNTIIGFIIVLLSWTIISTIIGFLGSEDVIRQSPLEEVRTST